MNLSGTSAPSLLSLKKDSAKSHPPQISEPRENESKPTRLLLLACREIRRNQANIFDPGTSHNADGPSDQSERNIGVTPDKSHLLGALLENRLQARPQIFPAGIFLIDLHAIAGEDLDDYRFPRRRKFLAGRLRDLGLQPFRSDRRD